MAPMQQGKSSTFQLQEHEKSWPILVCLLGGFRVLRNGVPAYIRPGGKTHDLLQMLAVRPKHPVAREVVLDRLWPNCSQLRAGESLNSLLYSVHRTLGVSIGGATLVVRHHEGYRLNVEAGIGVDVACFEETADAGDRKRRSEDKAAAVALFHRAIDWYNGDLCIGDDVTSIVERERLRMRFFNLLVFVADYYFDRGDYFACQNYALQLLSYDPCREDAHRLIMRCCVRQGARAQAMRQYRLCQQILRTEFETQPEQATTDLFKQICLDRRST